MTKEQQRKYKIRFNLGKGKNYMKWKITDPEGNNNYYDYEKYQINMHNCKLRNQPAAAKKIFEGANKSVCAWIEAEVVNVYSNITIPIDKYPKIEYNPRKNPYWTDGENNIDNKEFEHIITYKKQCYI